MTTSLVQLSGAASGRWSQPLGQNDEPESELIYHEERWSGIGWSCSDVSTLASRSRTVSDHCQNELDRGSKTGRWIENGPASRLNSTIDSRCRLVGLVRDSLLVFKPAARCRRTSARTQYSSAGDARHCTSVPATSLSVIISAQSNRPRPSKQRIPAHAWLMMAC